MRIVAEIINRKDSLNIELATALAEHDEKGSLVKTRDPFSSIAKAK